MSEKLDRYIDAHESKDRRIKALEAVNAAKDARIAELEAEVRRLDTPYNPMAEALATDKVKALKAENAALTARIAKLEQPQPQTGDGK